MVIVLIIHGCLPGGYIHGGYICSSRFFLVNMGLYVFIQIVVGQRGYSYSESGLPFAVISLTVLCHQTADQSVDLFGARVRNQASGTVAVCLYPGQCENRSRGKQVQMAMSAARERVRCQHVAGTKMSAISNIHAPSSTAWDACAHCRRAVNMCIRKAVMLCQRTHTHLRPKTRKTGCSKTR